MYTPPIAASKKPCHIELRFITSDSLSSQIQFKKHQIQSTQSPQKSIKPSRCKNPESNTTAPITRKVSNTRNCQSETSYTTQNESTYLKLVILDVIPDALHGLRARALADSKKPLERRRHLDRSVQPVPQR